ncbi:MAG: hypothetical protein AAGD28_07505 [Bacteroidota bacterium]
MAAETFAQVARFPFIETTSLSGKSQLYPQILSGTTSLLILVFEDLGRFRKAQLQANEWLDLWERKWKNLGMPAHEIPMMNIAWKWLRKWVDSGIRRGTSVEDYDRVSCFYGNTHKYQRQLSIQSFSEAQVFLLDPLGYILYQTSGKPEENFHTQIIASHHQPAEKNIIIDPLLNFEYRRSVQRGTNFN